MAVVEQLGGGSSEHARFCVEVCLCAIYIHFQSFIHSFIPSWQVVCAACCHVARVLAIMCLYFKKMCVFLSILLYKFKKIFNLVSIN